MIGGTIWGFIGDRIGRRKCLLLTLFFNSFFGGLSAVAPNFIGLALFRFLSGISVGGSIPLVFSIVAEMVSRFKRGLGVIVVASFWMVGSILTAGLAWISIPLVGWRWFLFFAAVPTMIDLFLIWKFIPESPAFLVKTGRITEAKAVLAQMARENGTHFPSDIDIHDGYLLEKKSDIKENNSFFRNYSQITKEAFAVWKYPLLRPTLILLTTFASISYGNYGLSIWFPDYFASLKDSGFEDIDPYLYSFIYALSALPGNILSIFLVEKLGRRLTLGTSMVLTGLR